MREAEAKVLTEEDSLREGESRLEHCNWKPKEFKTAPANFAQSWQNCVFA